MACVYMCVCEIAYSFSVLVLTVASIVILALVWNNLFIKNWGAKPPPQAPDTRRLWLGLSPEKNHFCPQNNNFDAAFNRQKPWTTDFTVQSQNEAYKISAKIIQKFTVRAKWGGSHNRPPPHLNTPVGWAIHCTDELTANWDQTQTKDIHLLQFTTTTSIRTTLDYIELRAVSLKPDRKTAHPKCCRRACMYDCMIVRTCASTCSECPLLQVFTNALVLGRLGSGSASWVG